MTSLSSTAGSSNSTERGKESDMPEIRSYRVKHVRVVRVRANTLEDAVRLANAAFEHGQNSDHGIAKDKGPENIWGNTTGPITETKITAERI